VERRIAYSSWRGCRVTYGAEAGEAFVANVRFDRVDTFDNDVEADVKLFVVDYEWVLDVALHEVLVVVGVSRQVVEALNQRDALASAAFGRFTNKSLVGEVPHVLLKVFDLIRQQERVGHEPVVDGEEPLQPANDHTEDIFLSKVLSRTKRAVRIRKRAFQDLKLSNSFDFHLRPSKDTY